MVPTGRCAAALSCLAALLVGLPAQSASAADTPWPSSPNWQQYVETPSSAQVCPTAVASTSGTVSDAANLICGGSGGATLTMDVGGKQPTIVLDYGKDVGGLPYFDVSAATGSPTMQAGYSESLQYLSATGDGGPPWAEGDSARGDSYTVTSPGTITNHSVQGGERYTEITLTSPGSITLSAVGINYIADRSPYEGYFVSSSDELNKIWSAGAYTAQLDAAPANSLPGQWAIKDGTLDADGTTEVNDGAGVLNQGRSWGDYTTTFDTNITANQAGWMVRAQDSANGYLFILDAADDTTGTPNKLSDSRCTTAATPTSAAWTCRTSSLQARGTPWRPPSPARPSRSRSTRHRSPALTHPHTPLGRWLYAKAPARTRTSAS